MAYTGHKIRAQGYICTDYVPGAAVACNMPVW